MDRAAGGATAARRAALLLLSCCCAAAVVGANVPYGPANAYHFEPSKLILAVQEPRTGDAVERVEKPSYVLPVDTYLFASCFWTDKVVKIQTSAFAKGVAPITTFAAGHGLDGPWGLQVWDGLLYVASFTTDAIHMYDLDTGKFVDFFGNEDELDCPEGMEFGPDGTLYVVSFLADEVVRYTHKGEYLGVVANVGLKGPEDISFLTNGDFVVSSHYGHKLVQFSAQGEHKGTFADIKFPVGTTRGFDGNIYVTSYVSHSISRYDGVTGEFIDVFATGGYLSGPSALAFASERALYICSYDNDRVVLYNSTNKITYTLPRNLIAS